MLTQRTIQLLYLVAFAAFGVAIPYLPLAMIAVGFSGSGLGSLLAAGLLLQMTSPPFWGYLADRTGSGLALIGFAATVSGAGLGLCYLATGPAVFVVGFIIYSVARTPVSSLLDALALEHPAVGAVHFGKVRRWGSMGFLLAALLTGHVVDHIPHHSIPLLAAAGWLAAVLLVLTTRTGPRPPRLDPVGLKTVYRQRRLWIFLALAAVHNACEAPFDSFFANYLHDSGIAGAWIGNAWAGGVMVEVLVMTGLRRLINAMGPRRLLLIAYGTGAIRWALTAHLTNGPALAAVQLLHGISFGAFFGASVVWVDRVVPASLKSSSQSIFAAVVWGLGGVVGQIGSGAYYEARGGRALFGLAALLEMIPFLGLLFLNEPPPRADSHVTTRVPVSKTEAVLPASSAARETSTS